METKSKKHAPPDRVGRGKHFFNPDIFSNQNSRLRWFDTVLFGQSFILFNVFLQILSNIEHFASEILGKNFVFKCMLNGSSMFRLSEFSIPIPYIFGTTGEAGFLRPPELISKFAGEAGVKKMETR